MAIQETIKTGRKYRKCIDNTPESKKWERYSFWTKSTDVEFSDGTTAESKLGSYKGVTTNENQVAGYAADVTLVKTIKTSLSNLITSLTNLVNSINDRLGGMRFYEDSTGKYVVGADSVPKKLGSDAEVLNGIIGNNGIIEVGIKGSTSINANGWKEINISGFFGYQGLTMDNFLVYPIDSQGSVHHSGNETSYYVDGAGVGHAEFNKEYNQSTGILKIRPQYYFYDWRWNRPVNLGGSCNFYKVKIYLIQQ